MAVVGPRRRLSDKARNQRREERPRRSAVEVDSSEHLSTDETCDGGEARARVSEEVVELYILLRRYAGG